MEELSKEKLLDSSRALFLQYGVKSVSMDDIASELGISKKTIYNFISNKKKLVHHVVSDFIEEEERILSSFSRTSKNAVEEMISVASHVNDVLKAMKPTLTYDLRKYYSSTWNVIEVDHFQFIENHICSNLKRGIKEGFYREEIRTDILPKLYVSLSRLVTDNGYSENSEFSEPELFKNVMLYHLNSIINAKGKKELSKYIEKINQ